MPLENMCIQVQLKIYLLTGVLDTSHISITPGKAQNLNDW